MDPDPAYHFDADPYPAYHFNADPDSTFQFASDPCGYGSATLRGGRGCISIGWLDGYGTSATVDSRRSGNYFFICFFFVNFCHDR